MPSNNNSLIFCQTKITLPNRPEFCDEANCDESDKNSYKTVLNYLNDQLLDKCKYETSKQILKEIGK